MLIAVDTNVLLDQALEVADVLDAIAVIKERLNAQFIVPPTVVEELGWQYIRGSAVQSDAAKVALQCMRGWGYEPLNVIPVGKGIVEQISLRLRTKGVIPEEEVNDSFVVAEAALLGCSILLSSDKHLLEAQEHPLFLQVLKSCDVEGDALVIARPRTIARRFLRIR